MTTETTIWAAVISAVITAVGILANNVRWRREFRARLEQVHEEVTKELIGRRTEPYIKFMGQLEQMSLRHVANLARDRQRALEFAEVFQRAIYGPVGVLASSDTRELIVASRAACLQYAEVKISLDRLVNRVWAVHQALRSDLGLDQPNWPNEIERKRLRLQAGNEDAVDAIVESAVHIGYGIYSDRHSVRRLDASRLVSAVIMDMDGLMVDSEVLERTGWQRAASDFGCSITDEEFLLLIGRTVPDVRGILTSLWTSRSEDAAKFDQIMAAKGEYVEQLAVEPKPGLADLLAWTRRHHVPTGVASSSNREKVFARLTSAGVLDQVDVIVGGDEVAHGKPAPDVFELAASRLGTRPGTCLVLEDSDSGIVAAHACGMTPILIPDSSLPRLVPADIRAQAYRVLGSLSDALTLLSVAPAENRSYLASASPYPTLRSRASGRVFGSGQARQARQARQDRQARPVSPAGQPAGRA